jgi:hypothetical protein
MIRVKCPTAGGVDLNLIRYGSNFATRRRCRLQAGEWPSRIKRSPANHSLSEASYKRRRPYRSVSMPKTIGKQALSRLVTFDLCTRRASNVTVRIPRAGTS